jgi:hypothetical protein
MDRIKTLFENYVAEGQTWAQSTSTNATGQINGAASNLHKSLKAAGARVGKLSKTRSPYGSAILHVHNDDVDKIHSVLKSSGNYTHTDDKSDHKYSSTGPKGTIRHNVYTPKKAGEHSDVADHHVVSVSYDFKA